MLIFVYLEFHNALCNTLHHNGVEFVLNSCWIQANPLKTIRFFYNFNRFLKKSQIIFLIVYKTKNPVRCVKCHHAKSCTKHWEIQGKNGKNEISLNSTWIQHQSDLNYCSKHCEIQGENETNMNSAWIQHQSDFNYRAKHCEKDRVQIITKPFVVCLFHFWIKALTIWETASEHAGGSRERCRGWEGQGAISESNGWRMQRIAGCCFAGGRGQIRGSGWESRDIQVVVSKVFVCTPIWGNDPI